MADERSGWVLSGRYRVIDRIGTGGMAEVFRAHDDNLDRDVAVKVFRSDVEAGGTAGADRRGLELQALAQLSHPNLITLFDGSMGSPSFLVMELVEGEDLADRLERGPLPPGDVREVGGQIASALAYVHSRGMAHRDVKPANILLGRDGRARLSDFGIVRLIGSPRMTSTDLTVGTASYLAPEQARGGDVGAAADVYSLGLVLIEAFTGVRCFDGPVMETMAARLTRPPTIPANLPPPWPQLLAAMTSIDPAGRPNAAQAAQTMQGGGSAPPVAAAGATTAYVAPLVAGAATVGSTTAIPRTSAMPPVSRQSQRRPPDDVPPPMPVDDSPGPWRPVLIALGLLFALVIVGVVLFALLSNNGSDSPGTAPTLSNSSSRSSATSHTQSSTHSNSSENSPSSRHSSKHSHSPKSSPKTSPSTHTTSSSPDHSSSSDTTSASSSSSSKPKPKVKPAPPPKPKPKPKSTPKSTPKPKPNDNGDGNGPGDGG